MGCCLIHESLKEANKIFTIYSVELFFNTTELSERTNPIKTLISNFWLLELQENKFLLLELLDLWFFVVAAQAEWSYSSQGDIIQCCTLFCKES